MSQKKEFVNKSAPRKTRLCRFFRGAGEFKVAIISQLRTSHFKSYRKIPWQGSRGLGIAHPVLRVRRGWASPTHCEFAVANSAHALPLSWQGLEGRRSRSEAGLSLLNFAQEWSDSGTLQSLFFGCFGS